jgi:RNA polymerase sigma factor (sigma-70 family)
VNSYPLSSSLDHDLVAGAREGDRNAFGVLVVRHQSAVCGVAYSICGDIAASEDVAQEAFVAAWTKLEELREALRFRAWVCGIARQLALNYIRRLHRRGDRVPSGFLTDPASEEASPAEMVISNEEKNLLWRTLGRLPESYREPLVLFYREQQSVAAVASALELSEETVKQRLSRGRVLLREEMTSVLEGLLGKTQPGGAFTAGVLGALPPVLAGAGVAATVGTAKAATSTSASTVATSTGVASGAVLASLVSGAVGALGLYVAFRLWRASSFPPAYRRIIVRLAITSCGVSLLLGTFIAWFAFTNGQGVAALGLPPAPTLAVVIATVVILNLVMTVAANRRLMQLGRQSLMEGEALRMRWPGASVQGKRYRSSWQWAGLPLVSIAFGPETTRGKVRGVAKGWIAVGDVAWGGVVAVGGIAMGPIALGGCAVGLFALSGFGLGVVSLGGLSLGWIACGGLAVAWKFAVGGLALAVEGAVGGVAVARDWAVGGFVLAKHANESLASVDHSHVVEKIIRWLPYAGWLSLLAVPSLVYVLRRLRNTGTQNTIST